MRFTLMLAGIGLALAFAPAQPKIPPLLLSSAREWDSQTGTDMGTLRLWDVASMKQHGD